MSLPHQPQALPSRLRCGNHPDREGVGICVSCRTVVCVECSTKIDRMNYCIRCLTAASTPVATEAAGFWRGPVGGVLGILAGAGLTLTLFFLLGFVLATVRSFMPGGVRVG